MILIQIQQVNKAGVLVESALRLAKQLKKELKVLSFVETEDMVEKRKIELQNLMPENQIFVLKSNESSISAQCEQLEASFLIIQTCTSKNIRTQLKHCRDLRIPYMFFKDEFQPLNLDKVMLPIGFLEEELEKAQFASAFGRFCNSEIFMLLANDYGSKAASNAEKMKILFNKFELSYLMEKAKADSFKVEREAMVVAENAGCGIIIVSASRDYGLDDILFGPKEYHLIKKSTIPMLIINPRGDLYALCD